MEMLGKPLSYWIEVDKDLKNKDTSELISEVVILRSKISFYESRIKQLSDFMDRIKQLSDFMDRNLEIR